MKKLFSLIFILAAISVQAQNATAIFNKVVSTFKASGTVSASY